MDGGLESLSLPARSFRRLSVRFSAATRMVRPGLKITTNFTRHDHALPCARVPGLTRRTLLDLKDTELTELQAIAIGQLAHDFVQE